MPKYMSQTPAAVASVAHHHAAAQQVPIASVAPVTSLHQMVGLPGQVAVAPPMTLPGFSMAAGFPNTFSAPVMTHAAPAMMVARPAIHHHHAPAILPVAQPQMMMAPMMTMRPQFANQGKPYWRR